MKRDLRGLGSLSKPAGLVGYRTTVGTPQASAACSPGGVTGLAPEGECSTGSTGNLIHLCWEIWEGAAPGWAPDLLPAPRASPATTGRAGQVKQKTQQPVQPCPLPATSLGAGAGSPALPVPLQPLPQPDPSSSLCQEAWPASP